MTAIVLSLILVRAAIIVCLGALALILFLQMRGEAA